MARYNLSKFNKTSYNKIYFPNIIPQSYSIDNYSLNSYSNYIFIISSSSSENFSMNSYNSKLFKTISAVSNGFSLNKANHPNLLPNNNDVWRKIDYRFNLQPFSLPDRFYIHINGSSYNNLGISNYNPNNIVTNNGAIENINDMIINGKFIVLNNYNINNINNTSYDNLLIITDNLYNLEGIGLSTHDSRIFYVWEQNFDINNISYMDRFDGFFLGRILFRGKQVSK